QRVAGVIGRFGGAARGEAFHGPDDLEQLARVLFGERCDDEALFFVAADAGDVAFLLKSVQGAADGRATHAQPFGDVAFDDAGAGREAAGDDEVAELLVGADDAVAARRAFDGGLVRPGGFGDLGHGGQVRGGRGIGKTRRPVGRNAIVYLEVYFFDLHIVGCRPMRLSGPVESPRHRLSPIHGHADGGSFRTERFSRRPRGRDPRPRAADAR